MAAITQTVPTFLGGVSRQSDTKKLSGQVNEIINGYTDPTYGLLKRNGSQFLGTIATYINDATDDLKDGYWFSIARDNDEKYIGVITKTGNIRIWNTVPQNVNGVLSFVEATINNKTATDVVSYLTTPAGQATLDNFHLFSYLDRSYIINKSKTVTMAAKSNYYLKTRATVVLGSIDYDVDYVVWLNGARCAFKSISLADAETRQEPLDAEEILTNLRQAILNITSDFTVTRYSNSLEIEINDGVTAFDIEVEGGVAGVSLTVYQDEVSSSAKLSATTKPGRRVKIVNTLDARSSYFVRFQATGTSTYGLVNAGTGYWEETRGWDINTDAEGNPIKTGVSFIAQLASTSLNAQTMPYRLVNTAKNVFTIEAETWSPRLTGNDYTNPVPTFVDAQIKFGLIYSNRLLFLTSDTVVMSVAKEFQNFFFTSAQTTIASDPVDLEATSSKISNLYCAVPQAQGLILFSEYEQYLLYSESGIISPLDVILRTISQYESDRTVDAQDVGDFIAFISRASTYTRVLGMQLRGNLEPAQISDTSKVVGDYLPNDVRALRVNTADSLLSLFSQQTNTLYFYKYYSVGTEQLMQAWFSWKVPGTLQTYFTINNYLVLVTRSDGQYKVLIVDLVQNPDNDLTLSRESVRLDYSYIVGSAGTITYNSNTNKSTIPKPYTHLSNQTPVVITIPQVTAGPSTDYNNLFVETGASTTAPSYIMEAEIDGSGNWLVNGDWTGKEFELCAGYEFNFDVELPRLFYRVQNNIDWTASLTISRIKLDVGFSGAVDFYIKRYGSPEWNLSVGVQYANYYLSNSSPIIDRTTLTVPIHQKNTNYDLKISSKSPFPLALNGMTWEGNYTPRYYRRA